MSDPEAETMKKPLSNTLFRVLDGVLSFSHKEIQTDGNSDDAKQGWARVLVLAVLAYCPLLKDEELELRVIALESN